MKRSSLLLFLCLVIIMGGASGQSYPEHSIRVIVNFAAGGNVDILARLVAKQMEDDLGWRFIIDNRGGANGLIGVQAAIKSPADGYTLLFAPSGIVYNQILLARPGYDARTDLAPITNMCQSPGYVLAIPPALPAKSVKDLIALAKSRQKQLAYSTPGAGNPSQFAAEIFAQRAGITLFHVPYSNTTPQMLSVMSGDVDLTFIPPLPVIPHIKSGKVRALAFTGSSRLDSLPDVPTVSEAGLSGFLWRGGWFGWFAPARTSPEIVSRLYSEISKATQMPRVNKTLVDGSCDIIGSTPAVFAKFIADELARLTEVARVAKIKIE